MFFFCIRNSFSYLLEMVYVFHRSRARFSKRIEAVHKAKQCWNEQKRNKSYLFLYLNDNSMGSRSLSLSLCLSNEKHMHKNIMMPRAWIGSINEQFQFNELLFDFKDLISEARALEHFFFRIWEWEKTHRAFQKYISTLNERAHRRDVYFINICLIIKFTWELSLPFIKIICFDLIFSWIRFLLCRMRTASELHI